MQDRPCPVIGDTNQQEQNMTLEQMMFDWEIGAVTRSHLKLWAKRAPIADLRQAFNYSLWAGNDLERIFYKAALKKGVDITLPDTSDSTGVEYNW